MKARSALISLKTRLLLMPAILAATAAMGDTLPTSSPPSKRADAQAQAAALLSRPQTFGAAQVDGAVRARSLASVSTDGHAMAAALLNRPRTEATAPATPSHTLSSADGHAKAAALLSRPRTT